MKFKEFAIIPALATMLDRNEAFDAAAQRKLVRFLLSKKVDGLYIAAASGEGFLMNMSERKEVLSVSISEAAGKVPAIAYIGSNDTRSAVELAKFAEAEGADAISSVPPYYGSFSMEQIKDYYSRLTESVSIPLIVYNHSNARQMSLNEIKDIFSIPNCAGIKHTFTNHSEMKQIKMQNESKLVFSGVDQMIASAMITGVDGAIGCAYNYIPELYIEMRKAFMEGNNNKLMLLNELGVKIVEISHMFAGNGCMKAAIEILGIGGRCVKSPNTTLNGDAVELLKKRFMELHNQYNLEHIEFFNYLKA